MSAVGPRTWLRALFGEREAILTLAGSPAVLAVGFLFVLSATLAREYDGAYLLREPWHLVLPLAFSTVAASIFWWAFLRRGRETAPSWSAFLGLFWMSAPLAWLYGIPYERFLAPLEAYKANLWTLLVVAVWRVLWLTRVLAVLSSGSFVRVLSGVLWIASIELLVVAWTAPRPVMNIMGGVRGSKLERVIGDTNDLLLVFSILAFTVTSFAVLMARPFRAAAWAPFRPQIEGRPLRRFALVSLVAWVLPLAWTQPEQARRWSVERDLRDGELRRAVAAMSARAPSDFPPAWDPPPHAYFEEPEPDAMLVLLEILDQSAAPWVADLFVAKLFHVYYDEDATRESVLAQGLRSCASEFGEERARKLLALLVRHSATLEPAQREAVEKLRLRVEQGHSLAEPPAHSGTQQHGAGRRDRGEPPDLSAPSPAYPSPR